MLERLLGSGPDLDTLQMSVRAVVVFFAAIAIVRIGGMRAFGARSPFDTIVAILLGGVLSRAVVGASPLVATCVACAMFAIVHRVLAVLGARLSPIARILNGSPRRLFHDGRADAAPRCWSPASARVTSTPPRAAPRTPPRRRRATRSGSRPTAS